jgi:hypothetical protein
MASHAVSFSSNSFLCSRAPISPFHLFPFSLYFLCSLSLRT